MINFRFQNRILRRKFCSKIENAGVTLLTHFTISAAALPWYFQAAQITGEPSATPSNRQKKKKEVTLVMCIPCRYISTFKVSMIDEAIWCASTLSSSASPTVVTLHQFSKLILHHCKPLEVLCNFPDMWQSLAVQLVHASRVLLI